MPGSRSKPVQVWPRRANSMIRREEPQAGSRILRGWTVPSEFVLRFLRG